MNKAVQDALVIGHEPLVEALKLPDEGDRHVLAAAIKTHAQIIVTSNLRDFPSSALSGWNIEAKAPDDFVLDQIGRDGRKVYACIQQVADSRRDPPDSVEDVLDQLERAGLVGAVALLRSPDS